MSLTHNSSVYTSKDTPFITVAQHYCFALALCATVTPVPFTELLSGQLFSTLYLCNLQLLPAGHTWFFALEEMCPIWVAPFLQWALSSWSWDPSLPPRFPVGAVPHSGCSGGYWRTSPRGGSCGFPFNASFPPGNEHSIIILQEVFQHQSIHLRVVYFPSLPSKILNEIDITVFVT